MAQAVEPTPVIFRKDRIKNFKVTAVFPTIPEDRSGYMMQCYAHIGQHGQCSMSWYIGTRPALPDEFADLKRELESMGYVLDVCRRMTPRHKAAREVAIIDPGQKALLLVAATGENGGFMLTSAVLKTSERDTRTLLNAFASIGFLKKTVSEATHIPYWTLTRRGWAQVRRLKSS